MKCSGVLSTRSCSDKVTGSGHAEVPQFLVPREWNLVIDDTETALCFVTDRKKKTHRLAFRDFSHFLPFSDVQCGVCLHIHWSSKGSQFYKYFFATFREVLGMRQFAGRCTATTRTRDSASRRSRCEPPTARAAATVAGACAAAVSPTPELRKLKVCSARNHRLSDAYFERSTGSFTSCCEHFFARFCFLMVQIRVSTVTTAGVSRSTTTELAAASSTTSRGSATASRRQGSAVSRATLSGTGATRSVRSATGRAGARGWRDETVISRERRVAAAERVRDTETRMPSKAASTATKRPGK